MNCFTDCNNLLRKCHFVAIGEVFVAEGKTEVGVDSEESHSMMNLQSMLLNWAK